MKRKKIPSPFVQGYDARYRAERDASIESQTTPSANAYQPFVPDSPEAQDWLDGWRAAEKGLKK